MELHQGVQKSGSQKPLHKPYMSPGRLSNTIHGVPQSASQRPPLKPVSENSNLLRSPGPLESMLKTTTETGDIGLFTIKPSVPPATYHAPSRPRQGIADVTLLQASRWKWNEGCHHSDDRRFLPSSYRDTTSEILSLYGSDAHSSRTFTPSNDGAQRSYSLTTCSSRHMPSQRSSGTHQSQCGGSGQQRLRSPFPYPTRLKRAGVRPSSPALTENGGIDYSRMVELDRAPHQARQSSHVIVFMLANSVPGNHPQFVQDSLQSRFSKASAAFSSGGCQQVNCVATLAYSTGIVLHEPDAISNPNTKLRSPRHGEGSRKSL